MSEWISVNDRMPEPEADVLFLCEVRPVGIAPYTYVSIGFYVPDNWYRSDSEYNWDYEACGAYNEERDEYMVNSGWYERIHNWDDYSCIACADDVIGWQPLPEQPKEANNA